MANAFVSMVVNKLREEVYLVGDAKEELIKLSSTLESIQAHLNDAEIMQFHNESMQVWLKKLKDVVYDVEDVVDEMIPFPESESGTHDGDDRLMGNQPWACLFSLFSCCGLEDWIRLARESMSDGDDTDNRSIGDKVWTFVSKVASQRDFASQIKQVRAKLDQIADDKSKFSFKEIHSFRGGSHPDKADQSQTSSLVYERKMVGRDRDKDIIISKLVSGSSSEEGGIHVISIVGVGGLGKTTLARLICNDERVRSHFNVFLWVCVSDEFDVKMITRKIIEDAEGVNTKLTELNPLQKHLLKTLQGKRFLLVLDDVWNDNSEKWDELWLSFQSGAPGSKILVTTRSEKVANTCMPSAYMHKLKGLSYDDCWLLFKTRAFGGRNVEDCRALEKIGREIVKKCKGVPLSVKVIGSVMCSKRTTQDWKDILESQTWEIRDIAKGILPALLLSYYNLPVHLKQCFAYCSVFPKDYKMEKDRLVKLWLAQGFIKPDGKREMEAIGGEYFDDLLAQSLFQKVVIEYEEEEEEVRCTIHDLLHDLIQFITKNECYIIENGKTGSSSVTLRHSSFIPTWEFPHIPALCHAKKLRTLLQIGPWKIFDTIPDNLFQCARSLRALNFRIKELPSLIGLLKHLRYLDLSYSDIVELPESVTHLRNLQTLKLNSCWKLARLPRGMGKLVSLRHLEIEGTRELKYLPEGLGRISSLRTLSRFIVGGDGGCKIGELKRLDSLQGKLIIEHLERVGRVDEAKEAQLENKLQLRVLFLQMSRDDAPKMFEIGALKISEIDEELSDDEVSGNDEVERMDNVLEALPDDDDEVLTNDEVSGDDEVERMDDVLEALPDDDDEVLPDDEVSGDDEVERMDNVLEALPDDDDEVLPDDEVSGDDEVERMDVVLEALRPPHTNLEKLVIERCIGSKFPTWMEDLPFSNLVDLRLIGRNKCTQLPGLGRLPSLRYLKIEASLVKRVGSEFYGNSSGGAINRVAFPKLEELHFINMYELEELELRLMPSLHSLEIFCRKLKALVTHLPKSLTSLIICGCYEISADTPPENFTVGGLKTFRISFLESTTCLPNGWKQLESLETLGIRFCSKFRSLPDYLGELKSLESLVISNCSKLRSLPDDLGQLKSLESLTISDCSKLRSLPDDLGQLVSLRSLEISSCAELLSLPQGLQGLTRLSIRSSPMLAERCRGEDWRNISHIPNIVIDWKEIKRGAQDEDDDK